MVLEPRQQHLILALDLGTSSLKAAIFTLHGERVALQSSPIPTLRSGDNCLEQEPGLWWDLARQCVRDALRECGAASRKRIAAVGICGLSPTLVLLGENGRPVYRAILKADSRAAQYLPEIEHFAGRKVAPTSFPPKLLWLKRNKPRLYSRIRWVLQPKDYLTYKLTGLVSTDPTDAILSGLYERGANRWNAELLEFLGLAPSQLPDVLPFNAVKGPLRSAAAKSLGLRSGIPVMVGCVDAESNMIGAGMTRVGDAVLYLGSGPGIRVLEDHSLKDPQGRVSTAPLFFAPNLHWVGAMMGPGGTALNWFAEEVLRQGDIDEIAQEAASVSPGADGLVFLSHLWGALAPYYNPKMRGAFVGLTLKHTRSHMARAVLEGIAFNLRLIQDVIEHDLGLAINELRAAGGGARSNIWLGILADILNKPIRVPREPETSVLGAAALAAVGVGFYSNIERASRAMVHYVRKARPSKKNRASYDAAFKLYKDIESRLETAFDIDN